MSAAPAACPGPYTREQVTAALGRAVTETEAAAGHDVAIDLTGALAPALLPGPGPYTREQVTGALNGAADAARGEYNPDESENGDTLRSDACANLLVNLAAGFLAGPGRSTDEVIAAQWENLAPDLDAHQVWNRHSNDIGDYCPYSGELAGAAGLHARCPQLCRASAPEDPGPGTPAYRAAVAATVKGWTGRPSYRVWLPAPQQGARPAPPAAAPAPAWCDTAAAARRQPSLAVIKRSVRAGQVYDVTNHYMTRPGYPGYGTTRRRITRVNDTSIHMTVEGQGATSVRWPKAAQVTMDEQGVIRFYGGGAGQQPADLFLTFAPVTAGGTSD